MVFASGQEMKSNSPWLPRQFISRFECEYKDRDGPTEAVTSVLEVQRSN